MSGGPTTFVARQVHDLIERQRLDALTDRALLARFLTHRDEGAFAALVQRHGPMVLGVARRILRHTQDAEDACQATFLVLARKGGTIRGRESLAGWLHRVAVRAAMRLRRDLSRRPAEPLPADVGDSRPPADDLAAREVRALLDAEVGRLPDRFRLPLVLCDIRGRSRPEAAADLGWTEGALRGRLERGRKLLRSRFARKGLVLPAGLLPLAIEPPGSAAAPIEWAPSVVATGLADTLLRSMALARAKLAAWATAVVLLVGSVTVLRVYGPATAQSGGAAPPAPGKAATDAERNLETFVLRVSLAPAGEGKFHPNYSLYHVLLHVPNLRLEPPARGPTGKPVEAHARITKDEAAKLVKALREHGFFDDVILGKPVTPMPDKSKPHAAISVRFQGGEDPTVRERVQAWDAGMMPRLDAIRECVDGDAARALDQLLGQLAEERKNSTSTIDADLKFLQGTWERDPQADPLGTIPANRPAVKCVIDGRSIVLKPQVQLDPLLDLETIRGTFELTGERVPRQLTIKGTRDTVSKVEPGTWNVRYLVTETRLTLLLPAAGQEPSADMKPRPDRGERLFTLKRVSPAHASDWGQSSQNLQARIRTAKTRYAAGESPTFDLDVRDMTPALAGKPWVWRAARAGQRARVEVDGVWYRHQDSEIKKFPASELKLGQAVDRWATVTLTDGDWLPETPLGAVARPLRLAPGKHRVRIGYEFTASEAQRPAATPISGSLEIEVLPAVAKLTSDWGEPSGGLQSRIRTAKATWAVGELITLELDVKAAPASEARVWRAARNSSSARIELEGRWYTRVPEETSKVLAPTLKSGEQVNGWATLNLSDDWVVDYYTGIPPGEAGRRLTLPPGKHTVRVGVSFSNETSTPVPVSGPLEIEVVAGPGRITGWKPIRAWSHEEMRSVTRLICSPDGKFVVAAGRGEVIVWDVTGPKPKEARRLRTDGSELLGIDRKGELVFLRRLPVREAGSKKSISLAVIWEGDIKKDGIVPSYAVDGDSLMAVALSPDGRRLAVVGNTWDSVQVFSLAADRTVWKLADPKPTEGSFAFPSRLEFGPDGKTLLGFGSTDYPVIGKINGSLMAWDVETGVCQWHFETDEGQQVHALSVDGRVLATGGLHAGKVTLRDAVYGRPTGDLPANSPVAIGLSPDGKTAAFTVQSPGSPRTSFVAVYDIATRTHLALVATAGIVQRIAFRPDGAAFVTSDQSGNLTWWERDRR